MSGSLHTGNANSLQIGGINLSLHGREHPIILNSIPLYKQFILPVKYNSGNLLFNVHLTADAMPDTRCLTKIFDSAQAWSMFVKETGYVLEFKPQSFDRPLWTAEFAMNPEEAKVFCGGSYIQNRDGISSLINPVNYPLDQLLLMHILAHRNGAIVHSAGMNMDGRGYIFPGKSGAGKSTLSRQFLNCDKVEMLSDDRMIIRNIDGNFEAFGTPWAGDAGVAENANVPLSGIFFIHHADTNMIKELSPRDAVKRLMPVTSIPWYDEKAIQDMLAFCEDLVLHVPAYELHFRPDTEVVRFLDDFAAANNI